MNKSHASKLTTALFVVLIALAQTGQAASATVSVGVEFIAVSEDTGKPSTMEEPHIGSDEVFIIVEDVDAPEVVTYIFM